MADWQERYPHVHGALAEEYRSLPLDQVELVVQGALGEGVTVEAAEGFFDDVGKAFGQAGPVLQKALPGAVSGAATGAALGPWGALGGALIGGLSGALSGGGAPAAPAPARPPAPRSPTGAPRVVAPPRPAGALAPGPLAGVPNAAIAPAAPTPPGDAGAGTGPGPVVAQLLTALASPTVLQALSAMMMGSAGAQTVPGSDGNEVPVAGITNMLGSLAQNASAEWEAIVPSTEQVSFVEGYDFATPEVRSAWLFEQLAPPTEAAFTPPVADETDSDAWLDELYDEFEAELMSESTPDVEWSKPWTTSHS